MTAAVDDHDFWEHIFTDGENDSRVSMEDEEDELFGSEYYEDEDRMVAELFNSPEEDEAGDGDDGVLSDHVILEDNIGILEASEGEILASPEHVAGIMCPVLGDARADEPDLLEMELFGSPSPGEELQERYSHGLSDDELDNPATLSPFSPPDNCLGSSAGSASPASHAQGSLRGLSPPLEEEVQMRDLFGESDDGLDTPPGMSPVSPTAFIQEPFSMDNALDEEDNEDDLFGPSDAIDEDDLFGALSDVDLPYPAGVLPSPSEESVVDSETNLEEEALFGREGGSATAHTAVATELVDPGTAPPHAPPVLDERDETARPSSAEIPQDAGGCVVCMDAGATHLVVPCGHQCLCRECASKVTRCPVCRGRRQQVIRVFVSGVHS